MTGEEESPESSMLEPPESNFIKGLDERKNVIRAVI